MYDLIGDIHGHADELVQLLDALGYRRRGKVYGHKTRQVIFLGDFIDRGPQIREVLEIVRPMVESGSAHAVLGNHELNALAFHTENPRRRGTFLRPRSDKNIRQHAMTMSQLGSKELGDALDWFRKLDFWIDLDGLRAVHACWDEQAQAKIEMALGKHGGITTPFLKAAYTEGTELFHAVETILKGKEAKLPPGMSFQDKDGSIREEIRTRWYLPPEGHTFGSYALQSDKVNCNVRLPSNVIDKAAPYPRDAKPVFVGHYWLSAKKPRALAHNVACLDYSVAKGGFLCAYCWNGEQSLINDHFVTC